MRTMAIARGLSAMEAKRDAMIDQLALGLHHNNKERILSLLRETCLKTGMGFAAIAPRGNDQWLAYQVDEQVDPAFQPAAEKALKMAVCDDIRDGGQTVVIDDLGDEISWARQPFPFLYGFKSFGAFPIYLEDGSLFGTLCAIDSQPRQVSDEKTLATFTDLARRAGKLLSA